jgi:hypothetical protein
MLSKRRSEQDGWWHFIKGDFGFKQVISMRQFDICFLKKQFSFKFLNLNFSLQIDEGEEK